MPIGIGGSPSPIPFAPVLLSPANAAYLDLAGTPEFAWQFQSGTYGNAQTAYAFRRKVSGASSYVYWNAGTVSWQSTLIYNTSSVQDVVFPAAAWTDGFTYNWSVAVQDASGTGPFAPDDTVTAQVGPTVVITTPAGTTTISQPTVQWTPTIPSGASQTSVQMIVYNAGQYGAVGFTPGSGPSVYDSGVIGSAVLAQLMVGVPLEDFTAFQVYVQITETGGQASPWAMSAFTTIYAQPAQPTLTAVASPTPDTVSPSVLVTVRGQDNLLTLADALTVPGANSIGTWAATSGTASLGLGVLKLVGATSGAATGFQVATPGTAYAFGALVAITGGGSAGTFNSYIKFYNGSGTLLGTITGPTVATGLTSGGTATAPATTAHAKVGVSVTAGSSTNVLVSDAAYGPSTGVGLYGGFAGLGSASITFSDDGGTSWWPLRGGDVLPLTLPTQQATVTDNEAPPGFTRLYQAVVVASGAISNTASASSFVTPSLLWWLKDPFDPTTNVPVSLQPGTLDTVSNDRQQTYQVIGRPDPVVLSDAFELPQLTLTLIFITDDTYQTFEALRSTQRTFLLQGPKPAGQWYVRLGATKSDSTNLKSLRGFAGNGNVVRTIQLTAQAVAAP